MAESTCVHCEKPVIAFIVTGTGNPGLWYLNTKPRPRPASFSRPAETQEDLDRYKPWNDQRRTVPCGASPTGRHVPDEQVSDEP
jgi:hypothetical protein